MNSSAVETVYRAELARVVRLAYLLTGDSATAEEIAQEAFARLIPRFDSTRQPEAFLTTVVVNLCRDRGRRAITAARHPRNRPASVLPPGLPHDVGEEWLAVQRLPQHHREAIVLRFWADLSTNQVARVLGIPAGTARSLLHRALTTLKQELTDAD